MAETPGRRIEWQTSPLPEAGTYMKAPSGTWYGVTPNGAYANLANHEVTEHTDGTITVTPSIQVTATQTVWHGYLERGVWRDC